ncbi:hypothetical protein U9M48_015777 [Paspalum notatum var. saurae]|uniref:Uncharacterized protein n=1 Tax=Paspalum notatum var. saurae TaxID=547442 RepID=A0AAQ3T5K9_PASNO
MDNVIQRIQHDCIEPTVQNTLCGLTGECRLLFFHVGYQGPVPTSDYCIKGLLTLTLTSFFLVLPHVTGSFFLTTVAKYSHGSEKVEPESLEKGL